jgi:hypothetical protein
MIMAFPGLEDAGRRWRSALHSWHPFPQSLVVSRSLSPLSLEVAMRRLALLSIALAWAAAGTLTAQAPPADSRHVADRTIPAVVQIRAFTGGRSLGEGSGFLVDADGTIVTNHHVVRGADAVEVTLATGERFDRVLFVAADSRQDLAILKIPSADLPALRFGSDRDVKVGDRVYVVGHPLGLGATFSDGLVSALPLRDGIAYVQFTAPISPGSSGGPVLNARGEVIGIATAQMREGQNLNFAVTARYARGLIGLGNRPRPIQEARAELGGPTPRTAAAELPAPAPVQPRTPQVPARTPRSEVEAYSPHAVNLAAQLIVADSLMAIIGMRPQGDLLTGSLRRWHTESHRVALGSGRHRLVAVCDGDCTDIDLFVFQGTRSMGSDDRVSSVAMVEVNAAYRGTYRIDVRVAACSVEPCFYAVRLYR